MGIGRQSRSVIVIGAGPAGLAFARRLAGSGVSVTLIERQAIEAIADPKSDGREIALTWKSVNLLREMGVWPVIESAEAWPLAGARVLDGGSPFAMAIDPAGRGDGPLGMMVSNHLIRRALCASLADAPHVELIAGATVESVETLRHEVRVRLADGREFAADSLVAADSRFSETRARLGIGAEVLPVGKAMLLARVRHDKPHESLATEWFDRGQTVAMLPLGPNESGAVLTLPPERAKHVAALSRVELAAELTRRTKRRWGTIEALTGAYVYPLTVTLSHRFTARRAALIGDAAVGMHPVTAHGFNFGLIGAVRLADAMREARDVGDARLLTRWALRHRAAVLPLYLATRALVGLYTDDRLPARVARRAVLRIGSLPPVRRGMAALLAERR
ncbi:MAG: 5-demethoxyubiquinol-8 5-hydroxylase UbiM [Sphingomonadales bacterium]|nr:5-demethoxyubiquinol-8 5-hydroxylase UbiM [Sphingomonadales bacterium]MDE2568732.1 5-demethoxyubiquinol-8 5-hydroxylase UbiM [Sphingomonadales bacterium]